MSQPPKKRQVVGAQGQVLGQALVRGSVRLPTYGRRDALVAVSGGLVSVFEALSSTWAFDGSSWVLQTNLGTPVFGHAIAFDAVSERLPVFGDRPTLVWNSDRSCSSSATHTFALRYNVP